VDSVSDRAAERRAVKAEALLNDAELIAAFDSVRASIFQRIEACPIRDKEALYDLRLMLKLLGDVKANLQSVVNTGKVIEQRRTFLARAKQGVSNFGR
jgi:hypothetical protein